MESENNTATMSFEIFSGAEKKSTPMPAPANKTEDKTIPIKTDIVQHVLFMRFVLII